jgi:hypothetical protein
MPYSYKSRKYGWAIRIITEGGKQKATDEGRALPEGGAQRLPRVRKARAPGRDSWKECIGQARLNSCLHLYRLARVY